MIIFLEHICKFDFPRYTEVTYIIFQQKTFPFMIIHVTFLICIIIITIIINNTPTTFQLLLYKLLKRASAS